MEAVAIGAHKEAVSSILMREAVIDSIFVPAKTEFAWANEKSNK